MYVCLSLCVWCVLCWMYVCVCMWCVYVINTHIHTHTMSCVYELFVLLAFPPIIFNTYHPQYLSSSILTIFNTYHLQYLSSSILIIFNTLAVFGVKSGFSKRDKMDWMVSSLAFDTEHGLAFSFCFSAQTSF